MKSENGEKEEIIKQIWKSWLKSERNLVDGSNFYEKDLSELQVCKTVRWKGSKSREKPNTHRDFITQLRRVSWNMVTSKWHQSRLTKCCQENPSPNSTASSKKFFKIKEKSELFIGKYVTIKYYKQTCSKKIPIEVLQAEVQGVRTVSGNQEGIKSMENERYMGKLPQKQSHSRIPGTLPLQGASLI